MKSVWNFFTGGSRAAGARRGGQATRAGGASGDYPNTFAPPALVGDPGAAFRVPRPQLFEPALRHFRRAFRLGDPAFADEGVTRRWRAARRQAARHVLRLVAGSPYAEHLVLRGSSLMTAWFGDAAREPRDLDFVVRPETVGPHSPHAEGLFAGILRLLGEQPSTESPGGGSDPVTFRPGDAVVDNIWTYDRVPGWRILLPWHAPGLPMGEVQVDVVFGERLWTPPARRALPGDGPQPPAVIWGADMPQSLAWKVQWLATDQYPQGKDLYDATLLAEATPLPWPLLRDVISAADPHVLRHLGPESPMTWHVDWDEFAKEYPWVEGSCEQWKARLARALAPTFAQAVW